MDVREGRERVVRRARERHRDVRKGRGIKGAGGGERDRGNSGGTRKSTDEVAWESKHVEWG